jgi:hypothetical protein
LPTGTAPTSSAAPDREPPGLKTPACLLLVLVAAALFVPRLEGPFSDGQRGNCGAMFAIMERNARALGWGATWGVPVLNPVPPDSHDQLVTYSHHPPGLPWAIQLAGRLPWEVETTSRLVALVLTLCSCWLAADLATRLSGARAGLLAGLLMLLLPAGLHHGLLVNYETIALPALLYLVRTLALGRGHPLAAGLLAGLADWIALAPLLLVRRRQRSAWWSAATGGLVVVVGTFALARVVTPTSAGETLFQALEATFLGSHFDASAWLEAMGKHLWTLYSLAIVPAATAAVLLPRTTPELRQLLLVLLGCGVTNVVLFAHHATSHEHFSLLLLPYVAISSATLLFPGSPRTRPRPALALAATVMLIAAAGIQAHDSWPGRQRTSQTERADALAAVSDQTYVHLFLEGVPLVFLHKAERHVWPGPVSDLSSAHTAGAAYGRRFGPQGLPVRVVLDADRAAPAWLRALGPGERHGRFQMWDLPPE